MGSFDRFFIKFSNGKSEWSGNLPEQLQQVFLNERVLFVAFGKCEGSYVVSHENGIAWSRCVPKRLHSHLLRSHANPIDHVSLGPNGEWFAAFSNGHSDGGGWSTKLGQKLARLRRDGMHVRDLVFGEDNSYFLRYSDYGGPF